MVVEDDDQLRKFWENRTKLPHLRTLVQYKGNPAISHPDVLSWEQFMALGLSTAKIDILLQRRMETQRVNECCTLIYTSGTTGDPKVRE